MLTNQSLAFNFYSHIQSSQNQFMASAGYDPRAALDLWDLMSAVEADTAANGTPVSIAERFSLLRTHPTSEKRQEVSFGMSLHSVEVL